MMFHWGKIPDIKMESQLSDLQDMTDQRLTAWSSRPTNSVFIAVQVIHFLINTERSESTQLHSILIILTN